MSPKFTKADLMSALNNQLFLLYQPIINLKENTIEYLEALIRWQHPTLGLIPPIEFIPLVEETGLMPTITDWVIETACQHLAEWQKNHPDLKIGINFSASYFDQQYAEIKILNLLQKHNIPTKNFVIELTENKPFAHIAELLKLLRRKGIKISIDDFGTGHSCFANLLTVSADYVKMSELLINKFNANAKCSIIAKAVIRLVHELDSIVIAEGVETTPQLTFLQLYGCDAIQGHIFYKAVSVEEITNLLAKKAI